MNMENSHSTDVTLVSESIFWLVLYIEHDKYKEYVLIGKGSEDNVEGVIDLTEKDIPENMELFSVEQEMLCHKYLILEYDSEYNFFDSYTLLSYIPDGCLPTGKASDQNIGCRSTHFIPHWHSPLNQHWGLTYPLELCSDDVLLQFSFLPDLSKYRQ